MTLIAIPPVDTDGKRKIEGFTDEDGDQYAAFVSDRHMVEIGMKELGGLAWLQIGNPQRCRNAEHATQHAEATLYLMENSTLSDLVNAIPQ